MHDSIVSLSPGSTEILFALGAEKKIILRSSDCEYPDKASKIPVASFDSRNLSFLDENKPDVVLTGNDHQFLKKECEKRKIKFMSFSPQCIQDIYNNVWEIARLVEKEHKADDVVYGIEMKLEKIQKKASKQQQKLYCEEWHTPPTAAAKWIPELIASAGGTSMAQPNNESYEVSMHEVQSFNPDFIVLHWRGFKNTSRPELVKKRKGWSEIRAVKENRIHCINDALINTPGPRIWQAAEEIQKLLKNEK